MLISRYRTDDALEVGVDEAGRGCLAGPVCAAAVMLPEGFTHPLLNDSKQLAKPQREALREVVEFSATAWAVGWASPKEIDEINVLNASFLAMHRALASLKTQFDFILVDGNRFKPYQDVPHACLVKGDARFLSIAAASILAKTHRDALMEELASQYVGYGWERNAGYPTVQHRKAIAELGATPHHRQSFRLLPKQGG